MCTGIRFTDSNGNMFWGRNLDWDEGFGQFPIIMPKGYKIAQAFGNEYANKHAAVGMGIEYNGYPLYFNCGNDAGLAVGGLNFPGYAQFEEKPLEGKTNVAAYEVPVWVAANFATVDEVEVALANVAIVGQRVAPSMPVAMLHWHIADAKRSIVVEYQADGIHVYKDEVDVLTNQPPFPWHMENLRNYMNCTSQWGGSVTWDTKTLVPFGAGATMRGIPGDVYSTSRFVKAAFINAHHPTKDGETDNVMRMFHTLGSVSFVEGCAQTEGGGFEITQFSDCFSAKSGIYYYNTYDNPELQVVSLHDYANADPSALVKPTPRPLTH